MITPDAILGVLGGGQLGRMFCLAARRMGYRVWVLDPDPQSPAGALADRHLQAGYDDAEALREMRAHCAAVTTEFENVPAQTLEYFDSHIPVRPSPQAVAIARDRIREKRFIREQGLATAPFCVVSNAAELEAACAELRLPAILKTAQLGYDGKGQYVVADAQQARAAFRALQETPCVLEERIDLAREISVVLARSVDGEVATYPVGQNLHVNGILDTTRVPANIPAEVATQATDMALQLATAMDYCGVLAVEIFHATSGQLLINEMAPRPHNSGHYTLDATLTSQFEQQVRLLCGLPPGSTRLLSPAVMVNLLGDLWEQGTPAWERLLCHAEAKLHLYGKQRARPGRKMGHYTCLGEDLGAATHLAETIRSELSSFI